MNKGEREARAQRTGRSWPQEADAVFRRNQHGLETEVQHYQGVERQQG
jgi:hypothetical protein